MIAVLLGPLFVHTAPNLLDYFLQASAVVKASMLLLLVASVISWVLIIQHAFLFQKIGVARLRFERQFWSGIELPQLHNKLSETHLQPESLAAIFQAGFIEFSRLRKGGCQVLSVMLEAVARAMRVASAQAENKLARHLNWLATIGSSSPYIGLFGTVWGIMSAFSALAGGASQSVTLNVVAPGISEALSATAMGLFAAIPAVIFYNHYINQLAHLMNQYEIFEESFIALLLRQAYGIQHEKAPEA